MTCISNCWTASRPSHGMVRRYPSLEVARDAANIILHLAPETNGEVAYRAFQAEEERMGLEVDRSGGTHSRLTRDLQ